MGLLDKINPQKKLPRPTSVAFDHGGVLQISWDDGRDSLFEPRFLRGHCPCAECVEEWSGKRVVGMDAVKEDIKPKGMHEVGRYAMQIEWSDGHNTGIYSWDYLLKLRDNPAE